MGKNFLLAGEFSSTKEAKQILKVQLSKVMIRAQLGFYDEQSD